MPCHAADDAEETGWKLLHGDVFRFPQHSNLFAAMVSVPCSLDAAVLLHACQKVASMHQDHNTVANEGFRAFKHASILGYELPQNLVAFHNSAFVRLSAEDLEKKIAAVSEYKSQSHRGYATDEFIRGLARVRGEQCNDRYAEAFELVRLVV